MDKQNSKKDTPKKNRATRALADPASGIQQAKEESRARHRDGGQSDHYIWGLSWSQFVTIILSFLGAIIAIITVSLRWHTDMLLQIRTQQKERARIVLSAIQRDPDSPLSFSLIFKNVGETTALNTHGAWLYGECQLTSSGECIEWCLQPLEETQREGYGPLVSQDEHKEEFSYTLKTGKARKNQRPVYFCGYFAYTDVFCVWHRQFYVVSYDQANDWVGSHTLRNAEEEAEVENCSPSRL